MGGGVDGFLGSWFNSKIYGFVVVYGLFECFNWDLWAYSGTHVSMGNGFLQSMVIFAVLIFYPMFNPVKRILILIEDHNDTMFSGGIALPGN